MALARAIPTLSEASGLELWQSFVSSVQGSFESQADLLPIAAGVLGILTLVAIDIWVFRRLRRGHTTRPPRQ